MIKFAIVGTGWIGGIHADRLRQCEGAELAYVFDVRPYAAHAFAAQYGGVVTGSIEETCQKADAIIIASSTTSHEAVAKACIAAGKPFLVEKPVAHNQAAATEVRDAAAKSGVLSMVGFNRRFHPGYSRIREAISNGVIGNVESIRFTVKTATPPSADFLKTSGGLFGEFGIHFFDLACWLTDDRPVEVYAMGSTLTDPDYEAIGHIDTAAVVVRMSRGALFQLDIGWRSTYGHDERLEVFGSKGVFTSGDAVITMPITAGDAPRDPEQSLPDWFERFEATYLIELEAFVGMISGNEAFGASLQDGLVAQALADAAGKSVKLNQPVKLEVPPLPGVIDYVREASS
ncbi:Gfo/Idh/MocA family oxidoreductase [Rhizobium sp. 18055]|uniref:Gfo/Idh/MocA family protein n=1 Tax=Rhizobium sp. 18055 TaxID=2681403 RepID=UPI0013571CC6|nr:Gfo/Idh/MocA family oxidoreductase [Rhizobium sp. 18055]